MNLKMANTIKDRLNALSNNDIKTMVNGVFDILSLPENVSFDSLYQKIIISDEKNKFPTIKDVLIETDSRFGSLCRMVSCKNCRVNQKGSDDLEPTENEQLNNAFKILSWLALNFTFTLRHDDSKHSKQPKKGKERKTNECFENIICVPGRGMKYVPGKDLGEYFDELMEKFKKASDSVHNYHIQNQLNGLFNRLNISNVIISGDTQERKSRSVNTRSNSGSEQSFQEQLNLLKQRYDKDMKSLMNRVSYLEEENKRLSKIVNSQNRNDPVFITNSSYVQPDQYTVLDQYPNSDSGSDFEMYD